MSTDSDSSASDWSVDFVERVYDDSSNDECVLNVENHVRGRTMRTRARTLSSERNSESVEDCKSSRGKRRSKAKMKTEGSSEKEMISPPAASSSKKTGRRAQTQSSSSKRSSRRIAPERASTRITPTRPTRSSIVPVRFGFEGEDISAQIKSKTRPKRKISDPVSVTPEKIMKESRSARRSRKFQKAELVKTPENTAPETQEHDSLKISFRRHGDSWSKKSVSFVVEDRSASPRSRKFLDMSNLQSDAETGESTPKRRSTSARKLFSSPSQRSVARTSYSTPRRRSVSAKKLFVSPTRRIEAETSESTPRRHSVRVRRSFEPYQHQIMRTIERKKTSTPIRGRGRPRKLPATPVAEDICDTDYNTETSLDDSDENYLPNSRSIRRLKASTPTPSLKAGLETPRTPRTPRLSVKQLTPSLPTRSNLLSTPTTPKDRAMKALHISSVPDSLPCRAREFDTIYNFLLQKIRGVDGGFLYIYGIPGAGKTATVERVIKRLVAECRRKKTNKFEFIDINGMHLKKPEDAYCQIWRKLANNDFVSAKRAKNLLENEFRTVYSKQPIVLLIDEFDMLFNKTLSVVDTILDWIEQSKLIVVAIANSKDLIEEINKSSSKSRMLRERLYDVQFKTYTFQQLQEIIEDRLKNDNIFTKDAIQLLARKSALSGDVRLALNLCRRVLAEAGNLSENETIGIERVQNLLERIHKDPKVEFMKTLGKQDQMLLQAIRDVILTTGCSSSSLEKKIYRHYKSLCIINGVNVRDEFFLFRNLRLLERYSIVSLSDTDCTIHTEISLGNNLDYVQMAFPPAKQ